MSAPAPPPEAQAGIRRSAPVILSGVAGASVIALLAVSSVVAPALAGGVTLATFLAWLGGLGGNALAGWLTDWASENLVRFDGDAPDRERHLLEQLARDLTVQLELQADLAAATKLLIIRIDAVAVALDALSGQADQQARLLQMLREDVQQAMFRNERLHDAILRAVEDSTRQILAFQAQGDGAIHAQLQALLSVMAPLERQLHGKVSVAGDTDQGNLPVLSSLHLWQRYLNVVAESFRNWHMPAELQHVIDWEVEPVLLERYMFLRPKPKESIIRENKAGNILKGQRNVSKALYSNTASRTPYNQPPIDTDRFTKVQKQEQEQERYTVQEVVLERAVRSTLIIGEAGAGKSSCLKYLCQYLALQSLYSLQQGGGLSNCGIPIYITLRLYRPSQLENLVYEQLLLYSMESPQDNILYELENREIIFLLDGLDEVRNEYRIDAANDIVRFTHKYRRARFVVSSRLEEKVLILEGFTAFEVESLTYTAANIFAEHYLGTNAPEFLRPWIRRQDLSGFVRTPLLLTLTLVLYKNNRVALNSVAALYKEVVEIYRRAWEGQKEQQRQLYPLSWDILEAALARLGYSMYMRGDTYSLSNQEGLLILRETASELQQSFRWPAAYTVDSLLDQLRAHNFLMSHRDTIEFWHPSFRDYFAALHLLRLPLEDMLHHIALLDKPILAAFVGGLSVEEESVQEAIQEAVVQVGFEDYDRVGTVIQVLNLMGHHTTRAIIRVCSGIPAPHARYEAEAILTERKFEHLDIFRATCELIENPPIEEPDWDQIGIDIVQDGFKDIMLALSDNDAATAREMYWNVYNYLDSFNPPPAAIVEPWLVLDGVKDFSDFCRAFEKGELDEGQLIFFCRHTMSRASIPYLEVIRENTSNSLLRLEASLAFHSLSRRGWD